MTGTGSMDYASFYQRSLDDPHGFWREQAERIDWHHPFDTVLDDSRPPFARWFAGGSTNLCHNAVDRHATTRPDDAALHWVSTEVDQQRSFTFAQLQREVETMAASLLALGVTPGDCVLIYLPMIPEAVFAMLACARIGALHSVVFGGFASHSLASRIDDALPKLVISADAGSRGGKRIAYKPLLDVALVLSAHKPDNVLLIDRGLSEMVWVDGRDVDYAALRQAHAATAVPCTWLDAAQPSYTLYTSGTTGRPKGVQRDTGGYAVALAASMAHIFMGRPGETFFSTSDIGWVVGHSYTVYGPLLAGMATLLYEGLPAQGFGREPDPAIWWRLVEQHRVTAMFTAPTALRVLKTFDPSIPRRHDLDSLRALFLAGEPLDAPTTRWAADATGRPVIDNYWQTESGWPILTVANGVEPRTAAPGSVGVPMAGYRALLVDDVTGDAIDAPGRKGRLMLAAPLPPGFMQTVWRDDARYLETYWREVGGRWLYDSFDYAARDANGDFVMLGRTDDVINVAGHRLGTREIEECIAAHPGVAEVAVVGVADALKGQVAIAFVVPRDPALLGASGGHLQLAAEVMQAVEHSLGGVGRPARVHAVAQLPKTRSGKLLRRALQALAQGEDPGELTTIEDVHALQQVREALAR